MEQQIKSTGSRAPGAGAPKERIGFAAFVIGTVAVASTFLSSAIVIAMSRRADARAATEADAQEQEYRSRIERLHRTNEKLGRASVRQVTQLFFALHMRQLQAFDLTEKEAKIATMAAFGETSAAIAKHLCVSDSTVRHHLGSVYRKTNTRNRQELRGLIRALLVQDRSGPSAVAAP